MQGAVQTAVAKSGKGAVQGAVQGVVQTAGCFGNPQFLTMIVA